MTLGTTLVNDIYEAAKPSTDPTSFVAGMQTALGNYLSQAVYADGALTYVSTGSPTFATTGDAAGSAAALALVVTNYWMPAGVGVGVPAIPTQQAAVVAGVITATTITAILTTSLTAIFADLESGQYWTNEELADHTTVTGAALTLYDDNPILLVYNTTTSTWYNRQANAWTEVTDTKAHSIAEAIEAAVSTIVVTWTEVTPPAGAVPYIGGIE